MAEREKFMTGQEYYEITFSLGKNLRSMSKFLRVAERTSYRYAHDESVTIPCAIADILRLLKAEKFSFDDVEKLRPPPPKLARKRAVPKRK